MKMMHVSHQTLSRKQYLRSTLDSNSDHQILAITDEDTEISVQIAIPLDNMISVIHDIANLQEVNLNDILVDIPIIIPAVIQPDQSNPSSDSVIQLVEEIQVTPLRSYAINIQHMPEQQRENDLRSIIPIAQEFVYALLNNANNV
jgi:hypothetical protein